MHAFNSTNNAPDSTFKCRGGTFDTSSSLTSKTLTPCQRAPSNGSDLEACNFESSDLADRSLSVVQMSDHLQIGDALFADFPFELIMSDNEFTSSTFAMNLLGLGYSVNPETPFSNRYPDLLESLVNSGVIESRVFGVVLAAGSSDPLGELTLGGFDSGRFASAPVTIGFLPFPHQDSANDNGTTDMVSRPAVPITNVTIKSYSFNKTFTYPSLGRPYAAMLDYYGSGWDVPPEIFDAIMHILNSTGEFPTGWYHVPCEDNNITNPNIFIEFGGRFTHLILHDLLTPWINVTGTRYIDTEGRELCNLTIRPVVAADNTFLYMGTSVIGDLYTIFDFDNGQITMGEALFSGAVSNPVAVGKGSGAVEEALKGPQVSSKIHPQISVGPNSADIAGMASTVSTSLNAVSASPLTYDPNDQNYLPLDARLATISSSSSVQSIVSSGTQSSITHTPTAEATNTMSSGNITTGMGNSPRDQGPVPCLMLKTIGLRIILELIW